MPNMFLRTHECDNYTVWSHLLRVLLFAAVKAGIQRARMEHHPWGNRGRGAAQARYVLICFALDSLLCGPYFVVQVPGLSLDYTWVGWERRRGDWLESEGHFQLLILHLCGILYTGFRNSL